MEKARYLYSELANAIQARKNCEAHAARHCDGDSTDWKHIYTQNIHALEHLLPHGSGIDNGCKVDLDRSHGDRLVIHFGYHHMDSNGMYAGWSEFTAIVTPSFSGIHIRITGRNRNNIKDYLYDTFYDGLRAVIISVDDKLSIDWSAS
jgi:hypothetical protein